MLSRRTAISLSTPITMRASSTKKPEPGPSPSPTPPESKEESAPLQSEGGQNFDVNNIKGLDSNGTWAEGAEGDGLGESITLTVHHPLPLDAVMIAPGDKEDDSANWTKNNRVAELEITL